MGSSVAGEMLIITKDQYELLRKEFRNEAYLLAFDILFWTGCREGEMLALLPKDLTDDDQLRIYKTYHRKKGQDIFGPTKNSKKGGNRNVPIPHWLAEEFRTYCSRLYGLTPDDRVFYMTCTALNKELTRCTQLTYLPDIRVLTCGTATFPSASSWATPSFWWQGESATPFPSSCELMPICTPTSSRSLCRSWRPSAPPLLMTMNPI